VVALGLRILFVAGLQRTPCFWHPMNEAQRYMEWARLIRTTSLLPMSPPFDEGPGYPYLLALVSALLGDSPMVVAGLQVVLGAATALLVAIVSARASGERKVGVVAGLLAAGYGPFIVHTAEVVPLTLFLFVLTLSVLATVPRAGKAGASDPSPTAPPRFWLASLAWTAAVLIRSEAIVAMPLVVLQAIRMGGRWAGLRVAAGVLVYIGVSTAANWRATEQVVPLTLGAGLNLWVGNGSGADGVSPFVEGQREAQWRAITAGTEGRPIEQDRRLRSAAVLFSREHPRSAIRLLLEKVVLTVSHPELPNSVDLAWEAEQSGLFALPLFPVGFGALALLAALGAAGAGDERRHWPLLAGVAAIAVVTCVVFFVNSRFRMPLALALMPLAARGLLRALDPRSLAAGKGWRWSALAAAVVVVVSLIDPMNAGRYHIPELDVNVAMCERAAGRPARAVARLRSALAATPTDGLAWLQLALAQEQSGDRAAAAATFAAGRRHIAATPSLARSAQALGDRYGLGPPVPGPGVTATSAAQ
jgi:hypothetical protein